MWDRELEQKELLPCARGKAGDGRAEGWVDLGQWWLLGREVLEKERQLPWSPQPLSMGLQE